MGAGLVGNRPRSARRRRPDGDLRQLVEAVFLKRGTLRRVGAVVGRPLQLLNGMNCGSRQQTVYIPALRMLS